MAALLAALLFAHLLPDPRVLVIVPSPSGLEVRVNDMDQPGSESIELKRRFDEDRDGRIADWEKKDLGEFLVERVKVNLAVTQDGRPLDLKTLSWKLTGTEGQVEDGANGLSLDLVLEARPKPDPKGQFTITLSDWRPDGHVVRAVVMPQGARVLSASPGSLSEEGLVTGVDLSKGHPLTLTWSATAR